LGGLNAKTRCKARLGDCGGNNVGRGRRGREGKEREEGGEGGEERGEGGEEKERHHIRY